MSRKDGIWLRDDADKGKLRDAEVARKNRRELQGALTSGQVSRRDLVKWGLFTAAGTIAPIGGLSPFVRSAHAFGGGSGSRGSGVPTGLPASPTFHVTPFSEPLYRFDILPQGSFATPIVSPLPGVIPVNPTALSPAPLAQVDTTQVHTLNPALGTGTGPNEGRPPGPIWAHQQFASKPPLWAIELKTGNVVTNNAYSPGVASNFNNSINPASPVPAALSAASAFPVQTNNSMWTFAETFPPKLIMARYGQPILFRHHNDTPYDITQNGVNNFGPAYAQHPRAQRPSWRGERRLHRRLFLSRPILRLSLSVDAGGMDHHQHRRDRSPCRRPERQWRHYQSSR